MRTLDTMYLLAKWRLKAALEKVVPGDSHFVAILVAIIIVLAIGVTFKDSIMAWLGRLFPKFETTADGLF